MKSLTLPLYILLLISCNTDTQQTTLPDEPIDENHYVELGGELQYVEIKSSSNQHPVLLFMHGGPGWPQTPQLRYYNAELAEHYTLVIWEQRGAGNSYKKNPNPANLNLDQIVKDGHELTDWLKTKFNKEKIYLAGYSWGSLIGVRLAQAYPDDYLAYIGIAQVVNMDEGMKISRDWLKKEAEKENDAAALASIDSLQDLANYKDPLDRFFRQWLLLNQFDGATFNKASEKETEKAMSYYDDYKDYDWFAVWENSANKTQDDFYRIDVRQITRLDIPVYLLQGRHDWNIPSTLAADWLSNLNAPKKKLHWFEKSGHGPLEEEPEEFNKTMIGILKDIQS